MPPLIISVQLEQVLLLTPVGFLCVMAAGTTQEQMSCTQLKTHYAAAFQDDLSELGITAGFLEDIKLLMLEAELQEQNCGKL